MRFEQAVAFLKFLVPARALPVRLLLEVARLQPVAENRGGRQRSGACRSSEGRALYPRTHSADTSYC